MKREEFIKKFEKFKVLEQKKSENGTLLIGNPYKEKPYWWLIHIYPTVKSKELNLLKTKLVIPIDYQNFLMNCSNGLNLFLGTLSLKGIRENYIRNPINMIQQPFSIVTPNIEERPRTALENYFFFGSYNIDGSQLYIDTTDNNVYLGKKNTLETIFKWNSFEDFINTEIDRILSLYDNNGNLINEKNSIVPNCTINN